MGRRCILGEFTRFIGVNAYKFQQPEIKMINGSKNNYNCHASSLDTPITIRNGIPVVHLQIVQGLESVRSADGIFFGNGALFYANFGPNPFLGTIHHTELGQEVPGYTTRNLILNVSSPIQSFLRIDCPSRNCSGSLYYFSCNAISEYLRNAQSFA